MTKYYEEPVVTVRKYGVTQNIFTSGIHDGDDFELDSDDSSDGESFFADGE